MAGGDSPRQKMINMMYIVLIAMLALNVDTKVLKKFIMINQSFEVTNSDKIIENNKNEAVAFVPSYLKTNSSGEYVFDYEWANAYHRAGGQYYPKLQISIPYTPVTGSRFLIDETYNYDEILEYISSEIISFQ